MEQPRVDSGTRPPISVAPAVVAPHAVSPNLARRRLMLGASAILPSVYTLSSGAATAAASTPRCWGGNNAGPAPQRFTQSDDKWYRSTTIDGTIPVGGKVHCVSSPQSACSNSNGGAQDGSVWVRDDGSRMVAGPYNEVKNVNGSKSYGLVYVDQNGTVSTLDPNGNPSLSYCADSCWNSIMSFRISKLG